MQGLIIQNIANQYEVKVGKQIYHCLARGKMKQQDLSPVVGDRVEITVIGEEKNEGIIEEILPRDNYSKRPKLANISQMILVVSSKMPKPDLLMLDKQLVFAEYLNIKPVIIINKLDLSKDICDKIEQIYTNVGYPVIKTNAKTAEGIKKVKQILENEVSVFSGNSGVGKSSLLNCIFEKEITKAGKVSQKNRRGKNTTTATCLYEIKKDTYIADTPGFSTFSIEEIDYRDLASYFIDFKPFIKDCEYIGCSHIKEENCGIKKAVEENKIEKTRYTRYQKIYEELKEREEHKW